MIIGRLNDSALKGLDDLYWKGENILYDFYKDGIMATIKRIDMFPSGGDCGGLNAVIKRVARGGIFAGDRVCCHPERVCWPLQPRWDIKITGMRHNCILVVEVFGRYVGHTALRGGVNAEASGILIP